MSPAYEIRVENESDRAAVYHVNLLAFDRDAEAALVDRLRLSGLALISLVAEHESAVVGHILFSPVTIEEAETSLVAVALGPMAVVPDHQGRGVGSMLVRGGLAACRTNGHGLVFVLGHPWFYPKFGFRPAAALGFECQWDVGEAFFMALELVPGAAAGCRGRVTYSPPFEEL